MAPPPSSTPCRGQCKFNCIMQGASKTFPGNASTVEYLRAYITEFSIQAKPALIFENHTVTYAELDRHSTKLALAIRAFARQAEVKNYNPNGDWAIALCLPPSEKLIITMFAIHKLGACFVPIDHSYPETWIVSIVAGCRPIMVISDSVDSTFTKFEIVMHQTEIVSLEYLWIQAEDVGASKVVPFESKLKNLADRTAVIFYTSGSTAMPKGVRLKHSTIMNRLFWQWETFPFEDTDVCCVKTAFTFVDCVPEIFGPLLRGGCVHVFSKLVLTNPNLLIKFLWMAKVTRILVVPTLLQAILSALDLLDDDEPGSGRERLNSIKLWVCSSETLHFEMAKGLFKQFPTATLCNFYGSTEDMGDVTYEVFTSAEDLLQKVDGTHVPIGSPIFNTICYVLNDQMGLTPEGTIGELYVAGYNLCSYVGAENAENFFDNPFTNTIGFNRMYKTGDYVRIGNKNGHRTLIFEGRHDSQIKVRGHRVDLSEIEASLNIQSTLIAQAVVLTSSAGKEDQAVVAFVVPATPGTTIQDITAVTKKMLRPYEVPEIKLITEVPLLVNGKIDRQRLLSYFEVDRRQNLMSICLNPWAKLNLPNDVLEQAKALVEAVSDVTHVSPIEVIENFDESYFNMGGSSVNAVVVVTKLRLKKFRITLDDFVSAKSLREMLPKMASTLPNKPGAIITGHKHHQRYYSEFLGTIHEIEATEIIAYSFSRKGDLEVYTNTTHQDFKELMRTLYPMLQKKGLSFIVRRREDKKTIAVSLNFDLYDEPNAIPAAQGIQTVLDFLHFVESPQKPMMPKGRKKILHSFMIGTHESVTEAENVQLVTFVEEEIERIARDKRFLGIFTTNTNPLTIHLCYKLLGYEPLLDYQINQYVEPDGSRPFRLAPDTQMVSCCWKRFEDDKKQLPPPPPQPPAVAVTVNSRESAETKVDLLGKFIVRINN